MKNKCSFFVSALLPLFILLLFSGCEQSDRYEESFFAMDTVVTFTFYENEDDSSQLCLSLLTETESELTECGGYIITAKNDNTVVELNGTLASIVKKSLDVSVLSEGYYDITVAPLVSLWNIREATAPPTDEEIKAVLDLVGYDNISLEGNTLYFQKKSTGIDLGSAGKGAAGDIIAEKLQKNGISSGIINLGGNVHVFGENPKNPEGKFIVGIKDPFGRSSIIGTVKVKDTNVITSGAYERYFVYENERYHHLLDPKTGYPANNGLASVTVICKDGALADMLSTAMYVAGYEIAQRMLDILASDYPDIAAVFVFDDGTVSFFNAEMYEAKFE
jgi:thiamine biosynthesis lipoprotein